eukprot:scaffold92313_cov24-Phaeocystis_antarctica.AAC.1
MILWLPRRLTPSLEKLTPSMALPLPRKLTPSSRKSTPSSRKSTQEVLLLPKLPAIPLRIHGPDSFTDTVSVHGVCVLMFYSRVGTHTVKGTRFEIDSHIVTFCARTSSWWVDINHFVYGARPLVVS